MSDVQKTWHNGQPDWSLNNWQAYYHQGEMCLCNDEPKSHLVIKKAADCHDLIRVLQEVHNEMCRREANPGTTDRKGWRP